MHPGKEKSLALQKVARAPIIGCIAKGSAEKCIVLPVSATLQVKLEVCTVLAPHFPIPILARLSSLEHVPPVNPLFARHPEGKVVEEENVNVNIV
jgi:hypothetical protein